MGKKKIDEAIQVGKKIYQSKIKPQIKEDPATWMHDHLNYPEPAEQYARWRMLNPCAITAKNSKL